MIEKVKALREEVLEQLQNSDEFRAFTALDNAVIALGGKALLISPSLAQVTDAVHAANQKLPHIPVLTGRRISHGDAAALVLEERGPTQGVDLLNAVPAKGGVIGGEKPMINLTSSLSKDARFVSIRRNGSYFWWFADKPLPADWDTGAGLDLGEEPAPVLSNSSQEGGEANAATTIT